MAAKKSRGSTPANDAAVDRMLARSKAPAAAAPAPALRANRTHAENVAEINRKSAIKGRGSSPGNDAALERLYPAKKK
jgi:hypothetical protein